MKKVSTIMFLAALALVVALSGVVATDVQAEKALPVFINGVIVNETAATVEVEATDGRRVVLNLGINTYIVDFTTGQAGTIADRTTDRVTAYYGPVETRSMPPQSDAIAVIVDVPENVIPPIYSQVEAIEQSEDGIKVTLGNGALIVTINQDTALLPYLTRNIVVMDNIQVGSELLLWCPMIATSLPAQATAVRAVVFPPATAGVEGIGAQEETVAVANTEAVDSTTGATPEATYLHTVLPLEATFPYANIGVIMVPIRVVAEALGYTVTWHSDTWSVTLDKNDFTCTFAIGDTQIGDTPLDAEIVLLNARTRVPVTFFTTILNDGYQITDEEIIFYSVE